MMYEVQTESENTTNSFQCDDSTFVWVTRFKTEKEALEHKAYLEEHGRKGAKVTITKIGE